MAWDVHKTISTAPATRATKVITARVPAIISPTTSLRTAPATALATIMAITGLIIIVRQAVVEGRIMATIVPSVRTCLRAHT